MNTTANLRNARLRTAAIAGATAVILALTGCSADTAAPASDSGERSGSDASSLEAKVAAYLEPLDEYSMPTDQIADGSVLEGKTVHYIPVTVQAPIFSLTSQIMAKATDAVGAKLQVCDGGGTPPTISQCIDGAINDQDTGVIILEGFFMGMAANAVKAATAAGIPVINSNQREMPDFASSDQLGYQPASEGAAGGQMFLQVASWMSLDSGGTASQLTMVSGDGPIQRTFVDEGMDEVKADCAACTFSELDVTSANFGQVSSDLSSSLLQDPNINYVHAQFAQYIPVVLPAVNPNIKVGVGAATLGALRAVETGQVAAASSQSPAFGAWATIDAALRLINGQELFEFTAPVRLFTADNIGDVDLTEEAEASGEWYGPTTFPEDFTELWGR